MNLTQLSLMSYDEILEYVISAYIREFGERKFKTVLDKIMTSNKISGLISTAKYKGVPPYAETQLYVKKIARLYNNNSHPYKENWVKESPFLKTKKTSG